MNPAVWQKMAQGKNIKRSQIEIKKAPKSDKNR